MSEEVQGKYNSAAPTVQDGSVATLQLDVNGNLKIVSQGSTPGTSATSLGKAEDAAHASGDVGIEVLGVRNDAAAAFSGTDLDYTPMAVNSAGQVQIAPALGAFGTGATAALKAEDAAHVSGDAGIMSLGVRNANGTTLTSAEGDYSPFALNALGASYTEAGPYSVSRKTADGQVKAGAGFVHTITIAGLTSTPTAGLMTVYDSLSETGTVLYAEWVFATVVGHTVTLDVPFGTGLFIGYDATLANVQATVSFR